MVVLMELTRSLYLEFPYGRFGVGDDSSRRLMMSHFSSITIRLETGLLGATAAVAIQEKTE
jgi:hypothetical protein